MDENVKIALLNKAKNLNSVALKKSYQGYKKNSDKYVEVIENQITHLNSIFQIYSKDTTLNGKIGTYLNVLTEQHNMMVGKVSLTSKNFTENIIRERTISKSLLDYIRKIPLDGQEKPHPLGVLATFGIGLLSVFGLTSNKTMQETKASIPTAIVQSAQPSDIQSAAGSHIASVGEFTHQPVNIVYEKSVLKNDSLEQKHHGSHDFKNTPRYQEDLKYLTLLFLGEQDKEGKAFEREHILFRAVINRMKGRLNGFYKYNTLKEVALQEKGKQFNCFFSTGKYRRNFRAMMASYEKKDARFKRLQAEADSLLTRYYLGEFDPKTQFEKEELSFAFYYLLRSTYKGLSNKNWFKTHLYVVYDDPRCDHILLAPKLEYR